MNLLSKYKFVKIGHYYKSDGKIICEYSVKKTERLPLVYAFEVDGIVRYIGETIQGYMRPLNYHKNGVMKKVQSGILDSLSNNKIVHVYARKDDVKINTENLKEVIIIKGIEQALIKKYLPEWNQETRRYLRETIRKKQN